MKSNKRFGRSLAVAAALSLSATAANALEVTVTIENLAPVNGTWLTPVWVGFHDGSFDIYNSGEAASAELEAIAEDGNNVPLSDAFTGSAQGVVFGPNGPIAPGEVASFTIDLDPNDPMSSYFSYAAMVLPSNDAFIANGNPLAHQVFDAQGNFTAVDFFIGGNAVLDAGTEVNDELPMNTAFFGQMAPNTGVDEGGVVGLHPGFLPAGSGGILDDPLFANGDFTRLDYPIAQVRISAVPLPAGVWLLMSALGGLLVARRKT